MIFAPIFIIAPAPDPHDIVDASYIAERTGLSLRSVHDGKDGVRQIPRARRKPAGWFRCDVDAWLQKRAEAMRKPKTATGPCLVRRNKRAA
jgi:predicted DNA-binding transcriptional regulator AlpA